MLPAFVFYGALVLFPLGQCVWISLYDWDGLSVAKWVGLGNYQEVFTDPQLRSSFVHSGVLIVFFAVIPIVTALVLAATLSRKARLRGRTFFRTVLFLPQVVASVVVATTWSAIYSPDGLLNFLLRHLGPRRARPAVARRLRAGAAGRRRDRRLDRRRRLPGHVHGRHPADPDRPVRRRAGRRFMAPLIYGDFALFDSFASHFIDDLFA